MNTHLVKLLNKLPLIGFFFYIDMLFVINDSYKLCLLMPQRVLQTCISCIDMFQCLKWTTAKFFFYFQFDYIIDIPLLDFVPYTND